MINKIKKNVKASDIAFYKEKILPQMDEEGGTYSTTMGNGILLFVAYPEIPKEILDDFEYCTKRMGYITNNRGMISLITDNILTAEIICFPAPDELETIKEGIIDIYVVLIDTKKDEVLSVRHLYIPESIQQKLQEQWLLLIKKGITFEQYQLWVATTLHSRPWEHNVSVATDKQVVMEISNAVLFLSYDKSQKIS